MSEFNNKKCQNFKIKYYRNSKGKDKWNHFNAVLLLLFILKLTICDKEDEIFNAVINNISRLLFVFVLKNEKWKGK